MTHTSFPWKRIHFVGIKGVAMTALAILAKHAGVKVTGSDVADVFPTDEELTKAKITPDVGFDGARLLKAKPDVVIYTGAHNGRDNTEVVAATEAGIPTFAHGQALGEIMKAYRQIVVAGSHGKTTTTAMIATILHTAKLDPSYAVGCGSIGGLGASGQLGRGAWFVAEGDEYVTDPTHDATPRFMWTSPEILVVTNIDYDHPDAYANIEAVTDAFVKLQAKQTGQAASIVNIDDEKSAALLAGKNVVTYGFSPRADFCITHVGTGSERTFFTLTQKGVDVGEFTLKVPGKHNVANAVSAAIAAHLCGVSWADVRAGLLAFTGTKRRFEKLKEHGGISYFDDYAHHPKEIKATLAAAKLWFGDRRIVAVFEPHTYSRTKALMDEFAHSFGDASLVLVSRIYASAREQDTLGITSKTLVEAIQKVHNSVYSTPTSHDVSKVLQEQLRTGDVVIFLGAGDIYTWEKEVINL